MVTSVMRFLTSQSSITGPTVRMSADAESGRPRWLPGWPALALCSLVLIGALLRLVFALQFPLWYDEATQWEFSQHLDWFVLYSLPFDAITALFQYLLGRSEMTLRIPSIIIGCFNIVILYQIGRSCCSRGAALFFSGLYAINPIMMYTDAYARMYSLWMFAVGLVFLLLARIDLSRDMTNRRSIILWLLLGFSLALSLWVHILSAYIWLAVFVGICCAGGKSRQALWSAIKGLLLAFGTAMLLSAVQLYHILLEMKDAFILGHKEYQPESTYGSIHSSLVELTGTPLFPGVRFTGTPVFVGIIVLGLAGLMILVPRRPRLAWSLLFTIPSAVFVLSVLHQAHFLSGRYLYPLFIPICLGAILAVLRFAQIALGSRPRVLFSVLAFLALFIVTSRLYLDLREYRARQDAEYGMYVEARALMYVRDHALDEDIIVLIPPGLKAMADFYSLPGKLAHGRGFGEMWTNDYVYNYYGYSSTEMPGPDGPPLWIIIRPHNLSGSWAKITQDELASLLCRPLNRSLTRDQLNLLTSFSLIKVANGRLTAAHMRDLVAEQRGQSGPALREVLERSEQGPSFQ